MVAYHDRYNGSHDAGYDYIFWLMFSKCPETFVSTLEQFLTEHINHDNKRRLIWRLGSIWCPRIEKLFRKILEKNALKPTAASNVLLLLAAHNPGSTRVLLEEIFETRKNPTAGSVYIPVAAMMLLTTFPQEWAGPMIQVFKSELPLAKRIAWSLLRGIGAPNWMPKIPAQVLAELWDWLDEQFPGDPYEADGWHGSITPSHEMYDFRNAVFQSLVQRNTSESCIAVEWLMHRRPKAFWIGDVLGQMRKLTRGVVWKRSSPTAMMQLFQNRQKRLIRSAGELQALILESLKQYQNSLQGAPPVMELWNEVPDGHARRLRPKNELNLSNCLTLHLKRDLTALGIIADREVEIYPRLGNDPSQLVDILVHAVPFQEDGKPGKPVSVVIEVKCSWNAGMLKDMERQLFERYLRTNAFDFGIYVAAYFNCSEWNDLSDLRRTAGIGKMTLATLTNRLRKRAEDLSSGMKRVEAFVLDCRLLAASPRRRQMRRK